MKSSKFIVAVFLSSVLLEAAIAINRTDFFGEFIENVTPNLIANDDDSSLGIQLAVPFPFFDTPRSVIFVNNNGALTFTTPARMYEQVVFPNNPHQLIAPFWADADTRGTGIAWYFESTDPELLAKARRYVQRGFVAEQDFQPTHLLIATWDGVGYFSENTDKTNTFQCILATDPVDLYVIFLYADIQWTTGDTVGGQNNGLGGEPAQVGFNAGDNQNFYSLPGSRTDDIVNIDERSNVGEPGVWVFHVSGPKVRSGGCSDTTNPVPLTLSPSYGNILGGETISVAGPCFSPTSRIECVFDGIRNSSIYVSEKEVLCIAPQLQRTGKVDFRLLIDDAVKGRTQFTSISIEKAHQVSATTPTNTVYFTAGNTVELEWNPLSIFPGSSSSDWQVTISMYGLNLENENQGWELLHIFSPNSPNDGQESIVIPNDLDRNIEILPIVFEVSASVDPGGSVQSGTLYTELVRSGQKAGLWTAQYYYINPLVANRTGYYLCQSWYESESQSTAPQLLVEATMPCPPQEAQARAPNSGLMEIDYTSFYGNSGYRTQWLRTFHQDAATCFSTGDLRSSLSSSTQECCYDGSGRLLTGSPGGGYLIKEPLAKSRARNFQEDVRPYLLCCTGYAPSCQKYYERRPSDDGTRYQPQVPAWVFGDPHLVTLDGFKYTFNGKGEFTFIQTQNNLFTMQGRMQQFNNMPATVITAIAAEERYSDRVMIANTRRGIDAYINGERADLSVIKQQDFKNVTVIRDTNSTISVEFSSGVRISTRAENGFLSVVGVVLPPSFRGSTTKGLLGVYNGNASDDLLPKNGITPLPSTTPPERIYNLFGLTWILSNADDSLFTYLPYTSFNDLPDSDFMPVFTVDSNSTDVSMCAGDESCIFDLVTTNDLSVGAATLAAVNRIEEIVQMSYPVVCEPACQNGACIANNTCQCSTGYSGTQCDHIDNPGSCDLLNPCARGESCAEVAGSHICTPNCSQNSTLSLCNLGSGPCAVNHCNNGGVCRPNDSISVHKFECICPLGYTGRLCDLVESSCTINPCQNGGSCSESGGDDFTCECQSGYSGNLCQIGVNNMTTIIIIAACVGVVALSIILLVIIGIIIVCVCTKTNSKSSLAVENPPADLKSSTLTKESTDGDQRVQNGTPSFPSREGSSTPANGVPPHNNNIQPPLNHLRPTQGHQSPINHYQPGGSSEHLYHEIEPAHDQTPPPPYPDYEEPTCSWADNNNNNSVLPYPVQRVQSDSSSINRGSNSAPNSSRSNTTSPNHSNHSTKSSIERAESLHKDSLSNRSTPSPAGSGMHQSHSHQLIPMRSSASTPAGESKKNYSSTLPHGRSMSGQYLSSSTSQISKMRRHSSSSPYQTSITDDGSGNLTQVTEV